MTLHSTTPLFKWARINPNGPGLHTPKQPGDVGWDLESSASVTIHPHEVVDIETNVCLELHHSAWAEIRARSSIARRGLQVDAGVVDVGYRGPIFVLLRNMNKKEPIHIQQGERVGQIVFHWVVNLQGVEIPYVELDRATERGIGGFGSTGA